MTIEEFKGLVTWIKSQGVSQFSFDKCVVVFAPQAIREAMQQGKPAARPDGAEFLTRSDDVPATHGDDPLYGLSVS